jgi:hypothetical protein
MHVFAGSHAAGAVLAVTLRQRGIFKACTSAGRPAGRDFSVVCIVIPRILLYMISISIGK